MTAATHTTNGSDDDTDRDDKTSAGIILYRIVDDVVQFLLLKSPNGNWLPPKGAALQGSGAQLSACSVCRWP
jgi:hypothetical protein